MTDEQIIKALECCSDGTGKGIIPATLDLIDRLQAENERLNSCVKSEDEVRAIMKSQMEPMVKEITNEQIDIATKLASVNAILEFAERLKQKAHTQSVFDSYCGNKYICDVSKVYVQDIDNLVKEMVGEE